MAEPPSDAGAVQYNSTLVSPIVAARFVGAPGTVAGVTALDADDAEPVPTALVAVTVNVYETPFVRPVMVIGEDPPVAVIPPGLEVTV
jgi:hypothetical protein